ncbi:MAG: hypothetical protein WC133_04470 [Candidatus Omnitrophota bacterium]
MNQKEKSLALAFPIKGLIDLLIAISLISLLGIPWVLARETQPAATANDPAQPVVAATGTPEPEKAMSQALDAYAAGDSIDFLMESPSLSGAAPLLAVPEPPAVNPAASPATLQVLQGTVVEKTDEVAMLVAEQCSQSGNAADGANSCERVYSNGHHATVLTQNANEGDELKHQTVVEEFDGDGTLLFRKTIRHRVDYNYLKDQKAKEKELFDITYQPAGKKTTRELMVYEYFLDTGKTKSLSWTQYQQIASEPKAELVYHALLRYGDDGNPDRGLAERWDHGKKVDTFMNWSRQSAGFATLDEESWGQWEGWIQNVSLQAYLP